MHHQPSSPGSCKSGISSVHTAPVPTAAFPFQVSLAQDSTFSGQSHSGPVFLTLTLSQKANDLYRPLLNQLHFLNVKVPSNRIGSCSLEQVLRSSISDKSSGTAKDSGAWTHFRLQRTSSFFMLYFPTCHFLKYNLGWTEREFLLLFQHMKMGCNASEELLASWEEARAEAIGLSPVQVLPSPHSTLAPSFSPFR